MSYTESLTAFYQALKETVKENGYRGVNLSLGVRLEDQNIHEINLQLMPSTKSAIESFIYDAIVNSVDLLEYNFFFKWLGGYQEGYVKRTGMHQPWFIVFMYYEEFILNPWSSNHSDELFKVGFATSDWFKQRAMDLASSVNDVLKDILSVYSPIKFEEIWSENSLSPTAAVMDEYFMTVCYESRLMSTSNDYMKACDLLFKLVEIKSSGDTERYENAIADIIRYGADAHGRRYMII